MRWRVTLISLLYFGLILDAHFGNGGWKQTLDIENIGLLVTSYFFLISMFLVVDVLVPPRLGRWVNSSLAFIYTLLAYYHKQTGASADFAVIANNWQSVQNADGVWQVFELLHDIFVAANFFWAFVAAGLVFYSYRRPPRRSNVLLWRHPVWAACLALGLFLVTGSSYSHDQFSRFGRSFYRWYFPKPSFLDELAKPLPLAPPTPVSSQFSKLPKPHIFLVMIESFNGRFIREKNDQGQEWTPVFNSLIPKGVWVENYYSPSVQTGKGHFTALCGQIPSLTQIEFRSSNCESIKCLPTSLREDGYKTVFMQAHANLNFDNAQNFLKAHGVDDIPALAKSCAQESEACYGWGVQDDVFYRRALRHLGKNYSPKTPVFAVMATIASHQPFKGIPTDKRHFYENPQSRREDYLNHLWLVDQSLQVLVDEIRKSPFGENAVVIITGDHGFPLGEHGNEHNENFAFEESFKVPFLILDFRNELRSELKGPFSHLNLPATILDLAGWSGESPFFGQSIFSNSFREKGDSVYLVQPYSGGYLATVQWPYKYVLDRTRLTEEVFNIEKDPAESVPVLDSLSEEEMKGIRQNAARILRQQDVLRCD